MDATVQLPTDEPMKTIRHNFRLWRKSVLCWIEADTVLADVVVFLGCILPHAEFMAHELFWAGDEGDRSDFKRCCDRITDDAPFYENIAEKRLCRLARAYQCKGEDKFLQRTHDLMTDPTRWDTVPPKDRTEALNAQLFIAMSKGRCRTHLLKLLRRNYPYKVCALVTNPELREEILEDNECPRRLDAFTQSFLHANPNVTSVDSLARLAAMLVLARDDMVNIEVGHGHLRRFVIRRSVQCKAV